MCRHSAIADIADVDASGSVNFVPVVKADKKTLSFSPKITRLDREVKRNDIVRILDVLAFSNPTLFGAFLLVGELEGKSIGNISIGPIETALKIPEADWVYKPEIITTTWENWTSKPFSELQPYVFNVTREQEIKKNTACRIIDCLRFASKEDGKLSCQL